MALQRLLLLIPTTTYRTEDFVEAARTLDVDLVIASDRPNMMAGEFPDHLLTLPFGDPAAAAREMRGYAARRPLDAVVPVDDATTVVASAIGEALGLRVNPLAAAQATRNKLVMRGRLARAGVPSPPFTTVTVDENPHAAAGRMTYPCVLKPLVLSASRGVIRADDVPQFVAAFERIREILRAADVAAAGRGDRHHPGGGLRAGRRGGARRSAGETASSAPWPSSTSPIRSTAPSSRRPST